MMYLMVHNLHVLNLDINKRYIDIRTLVNDDEALQDGILQTLEQYNTEQHITVRLPDTDYDVCFYYLQTPKLS